MIIVIGQHGCKNCENIKIVFTKRNIAFEYKLFNDFSEEEQKHFIEIATDKGMQQFPILIKNNEVITLEDALKS